MVHQNRGRLTVDTNGNWRLYSNTIPSGAQAIATVTQGAGDTGARPRRESRLRPRAGRHGAGSKVSEGSWHVSLDIEGVFSADQRT